LPGISPTPFIPQLPHVLSELAAFRRRHAVEDCVALLIAWLLGVVGLYRIGDLVHVLLLVGLMLLVLGAVQARAAAVARRRDVGSGKS
jgi:hypothetical protein